MKQIFAITLIFFFYKSNGQSDTTLKYSEVIQLDSINKITFYQRARSWTNDAFKNIKNVIQIDDKETGEIAGKGTFDAIITWNALGKRTATTTVNFKFQILVKDGRYKYIFTDFTEKGFYGYLLTSAKENPYTTKGVGKKNLDMIWVSLKESTENTMTILINSLKNTMKSKSESDF